MTRSRAQAHLRQARKKRGRKEGARAGRHERQARGVAITLAQRLGVGRALISFGER